MPSRRASVTSSNLITTW